MNIFQISVAAVVGIMIAVGGIELNDGKGRLIALGLAVCVGALTCGLRLLQKQIDELKSLSATPKD